jgi:hypothetical protein
MDGLTDGDKKGDSKFCVLHHENTDIQLTSRSAFIPGYITGDRSSPNSVSKTFSAFILMSGCASWEDVEAGNDSLHKVGTTFCKTINHSCALSSHRTGYNPIVYYNHFALHHTNSTCLGQASFFTMIKIIINNTIQDISLENLITLLIHFLLFTKPGSSLLQSHGTKQIQPTPSYLMSLRLLNAQYVTSH